MSKPEILLDILNELDRAKRLHPVWPADGVHQAAIMAEEAGEAIRAALHMHYHGGSVADVRTELVQTAAMCVRMIENLPEQSVIMPPRICRNIFRWLDGEIYECLLPAGHSGNCVNLPEEPCKSQPHTSSSLGHPTARNATS